MSTIQPTRSEVLREKYGRNWQNINKPFDRDLPTQQSAIYDLPKSDITTFARTQPYNKGKKKSSKKTRRKK
jgi:hypothetical protein